MLCMIDEQIGENKTRATGGLVPARAPGSSVFSEALRVNRETFRETLHVNIGDVVWQQAIHLNE